MSQSIIPPETTDHAKEILKDANKVAESATKNAVEATETVKEVTKEGAVQTTETVTTASDYTLDLLGIPVDTQTLISNSSTIAIKLLLAVVIFVVGNWLGKRLVNVAKRAMVKSSMDGTAVSFLGNLLYGVVLAAVVVAALNQIGISTTSFVAVLGA